MHNYQHTSTSMFIGHFALTPERWSIWAEILYWGSYILRLGLVRISAQSDQKNVGYPEDRPLCKGTEKQGGGRIIQMKICSNSYNSVPLILVILRTILFANHHLQRNGGAQRRPNHVDDQLQQSVLFCLEIVAILRFLLLFYSIFTDLEFVKKFTRPNFRAKEFYTLKTRKLRLFLPAIHSKNASKWVIYSFIHLCVCVNLQNM